MRTTTLAIAVLTLALVGLVVFVHWTRPSPGGLSAVHARDPRLAGSDGCALCHGTPERTLAEACSECHEHQAQQIAAGRGLHGRLGDGVEACGRCHSEHHGADFALVAASSFARAGISDPARFDHAGLDYGLTGRHATLQCTACHALADSDVLPEGGRRFAGLEAACHTCHEDPHEGKLQDCAACHGQSEPFPLAAEFVHTGTFPLRGAHAGLDCKRCHAPGTPHAIENVGGHLEATHGVPIRGCSACHVHGHANSFLEGVAAAMLADPRPPKTGFDAAGTALLRLLDRLEGAGTPARDGDETGSRNGANAPARTPAQLDATCSQCHETERGGFVPSHTVVTPELHRASGFELQPPHADLACEHCHGTPGSRDAHPFASRFPGRGADDCAACHGDPHGGQFAAAGAPAPDCLSCHDRTAFAPSHFGTERHAATAFPLAGAHRELACSACHAEPEAGGGRRRFRGTETSCSACHDDPHARQFADAGRTDCARCHDQTRFVPASFDLQAHAHTPFPLTGAHAAVRCDACHRTPEAGGVRTFRGAPQACTACHADVHDGRFDRRPELTVVAGRQGCARCHSTESFGPLRAPFDHGLFTDHPLRGAHARAACTACHVGPQRRAGIAAAATRCDDCHRDPHAAQFAAAGKTDCARCHDDGGSFTPARFDHAKTRFALDERHARLACSACHETWQVGGVPVVRYRPLGTDCADCHGPAKGSEVRRR